MGERRGERKEGAEVIFGSVFAGKGEMQRGLDRSKGNTMVDCNVQRRCLYRRLLISLQVRG